MLNRTSACLASEVASPSAKLSLLVRAGTTKRGASIVPVVMLLWGLADTSAASILEFDQIRNPTGSVIPSVSGNEVEQDYGDRVIGSPMNVPGGQFTYGNGGEGFTPNIVVDYFSGSAIPSNPGVSLWANGYGDLTNVMIANNNSLSLNIRLSADPGFEVQLHHFDLAGWPGSDYTISAVQVLSGMNSLFSQGNVLVEGNAIGEPHTSFDFTTPLTATELLIHIDYSNLAGSLQDNIGIDNIRFGQNPPAPIPLPSAWLLFVWGLTGIGVWSRSLPGPTMSSV